jgi:FtsZ-binding cell division protein ZapB
MAEMKEKNDALHEENRALRTELGRVTSEVDHLQEQLSLYQRQATDAATQNVIILIY